MKPMYKKTKGKKATIKSVKPYEAETIELTLERALNNKEKIMGSAPLIYTERSEGVPPAYDIRTDKMEVALQAQTKKSAGIIAQRKSKMAAIKGGQETGGQSIQATGDKS